MAQLVFSAASQNTGYVEIETDMPTGPLFFPAQVWLRAVNHADLAAFENTGVTYDGAHHEYYHFWSVRGDPLAAFVSPANMVAGWNNPNKMNGREVGLCLTKPGSYIVDLWVIDRNGVTAIAETQAITVNDPDAIWAPASTYYVGPPGETFTGLPATAKKFTDIEALKSALLTAPSDARILFKRGHEYAGCQFLIESRKGQFWGAWGTGARPVLRPRTIIDSAQGRGVFHFQGNTAAKNTVMTGLEIRGNYDASTEHGFSGNAAAIMTTGLTCTDTFFTFHDIVIKGMDSAYIIGGTTGSANNRMMVVDNNITDWRNFGVFAQGMATSKVSCIGNRISQNVDALQGGNKGDEVVNNHGPIRLSTVLKAHVAVNDLFSNTGWSPTNGILRDDQACLRLFTDPIPGQIGTVSRCVMEGGGRIINMEAANPTQAPMVPGNTVLDDLLLIGTAKTITGGISCHKGGTTIRNCVGVFPNVPFPDFGGGTHPFITIAQGESASVANNQNEPIRLHNNTALFLKNATNDKGQDWFFFNNGSNYFTQVVEENNVFHKPNGTVPDVSDGAMDLSQSFAGVTARYKGIRYGYRPVEITLGAEVPVNGTLSIPYTSIGQSIQGGPIDLSNPTSQAYWQANEATDTVHTLYLFGSILKWLDATVGHFSVSFADPTNIVITNTSGIVWPSGIKVMVHLDRTTRNQPLDTSYGSAGSVIIPRPDTGSPAIKGATLGLATHCDFYGNPRATPPWKGALEAL